MESVENQNSKIDHLWNPITTVVWPLPDFPNESTTRTEFQSTPIDVYSEGKLDVQCMHCCYRERETKNHRFSLPTINTTNASEKLLLITVKLGGSYQV